MMGLFGKKKAAAPAAQTVAAASPELAKFYEDAAACLRYYPEGSFAFCRTSIGNIAAINETYGRSAGDALLKAAREAIAATNAADDFHMLIAQDRSKFVSLLRYDTEAELDQKLAALHERFTHLSEVLPNNDHVYMHTGYFCTGGKLLDMTVQEMTECAKIAESEAAKRTHSSIVRYTDQLKLNAAEEAEMAQDMETALEKKQFAVMLQPRFEMKTGNVVGAKIMSRWIHPKKGIIGSYRYIPLFVKNGFIIKLDLYLFEQACVLLHGWIKRGYNVLPLSINVPRLLTTEQRYMQQYVDIKSKYKIPDKLIELEFSERLVDDEISRIGTVLSFFKDNGFLCSIENFGSGNGKLSTITDFGIDSLKLTRDFFDYGTPSAEQQEKMKLYIDTAKKSEIQTIATGVPSDCEDMLRDMGCDVLQGNVTADPLTPEDFLAAYLHK